MWRKGCAGCKAKAGHQAGAQSWWRGVVLQQSTPWSCQPPGPPQSWGRACVCISDPGPTLPTTSGRETPTLHQGRWGPWYWAAALHLETLCQWPLRDPHRPAPLAGLQGRMRGREGRRPQRRPRSDPSPLPITDGTRRGVGPLRRVRGQPDQRQGLSAPRAGEASGTRGDARLVHRGPLPQVGCRQPHTGAPAGTADRQVLGETGGLPRWLRQ